MKRKKKKVDLIIRPRKEGGCDWDSPRVVLARYGAKELWWHRAGKTWGSLVDGYVSTPARLILVDFTLSNTTGLPRTIELHEGGRLSNTLLKKHAETIDTFFGISVSEHLHPKRTLLIT